MSAMIDVWKTLVNLFVYFHKNPKLHTKADLTNLDTLLEVFKAHNDRRNEPILNEQRLKELTYVFFMLSRTEHASCASQAINKKKLAACNRSRSTNL